MTSSEIKEFRLSLGMTQSEFAKALEQKHKMNVSNWERGVSKPDRYSQMKLNELKEKNGYGDGDGR